METQTLSTFKPRGVNAFAHLFLENISLGTGLWHRLHCVEYNFGTRISTDLGKISKKITILDYFFKEKTLDGGHTNDGGKCYKPFAVRSINERR